MESQQCDQVFCPSESAASMDVRMEIYQQRGEPLSFDPDSSITSIKLNAHHSIDTKTWWNHVIMPRTSAKLEAIERINADNYRLTLQTDDYQKEELSIHTSGTNLVIKAIKDTDIDDFEVQTQMKLVSKLPHNVDKKKLKADWNESSSILTIMAPREKQ